MSNEEPTENLTEIEKKIYKAFEEVGLERDLIQMDFLTREKIRILALEPNKRSDNYINARHHVFEYIGGYGDAPSFSEGLMVGELCSRIEKILGE